MLAIFVHYYNSYIYYVVINYIIKIKKLIKYWFFFSNNNKHRSCGGQCGIFAVQYDSTNAYRSRNIGHLGQTRTSHTNIQVNTYQNV